MYENYVSDHQQSLLSAVASTMDQSTQSTGGYTKNKRLTAALAVMAVAMCAVVTMAATGEKDGDFDTVFARHVMSAR